MTCEEQIGPLLLERSWSLATAESCTGGLLAHRITNVAGSSAYYLGGFITYSNEAKEELLGVQHATLVAHGAVSEKTAREMARGARARMGADLALSITGIAGPSGSTPDKPVGLVFIALSTHGAEMCRRHEWQGGRIENKEQSAQAALEMLLRFLQANERPADGGAEPRGQSVAEALDGVVTVQVHTRQDGSIRPVGFVWQARTYTIESWGREELKKEKGRTVCCYLVQTAGPETWELCRDTKTAQWHLARHWALRQRLA